MGQNRGLQNFVKYNALYHTSCYDIIHIFCQCIFNYSEYLTSCVFIGYQVGLLWTILQCTVAGIFCVLYDFSFLSLNFKLCTV